MIAVPAGLLLGIGIPLDVLWWLVADRAVRRAGWNPTARLFPLLFGALQIAWLVSFAVEPPFDPTPSSPNAADLAGLVWHLLLAPLTLLTAMTGILLRRR
jgi:hypothetical protein